MPSPPPGSLLALDVGTRTIGLATCDPLRLLCHPLHTVRRRGVARDVRAILPVVAEHAPVGLVVGLPLNLAGEENRSTRLARQVGEALAEATGLPVAWQDERFTSVEAERRLQDAGLGGRERRRRIDAAAATVILQDFLASGQGAAFPAAG